MPKFYADVDNQKAGGGFYRKAKDTLKGRVKKKLTEKTSWYRKRKSDEEQEQDQQVGGKRRTLEKGSGDGSERSKEEKAVTQPGGKLDCSNIKADMFVPNTEGSILALALRELENLMEKLTGYRIKIQERAGHPIERQTIFRTEKTKVGHCGKK